MIHVLNGVDIITLPAALESCTRLEKLMLQGNRISTLPDELGLLIRIPVK